MREELTAGELDSFLMAEAGATKGPWFHDSYSIVNSIPLEVDMNRVTDEILKTEHDVDDDDPRLPEDGFICCTRTGGRHGNRRDQTNASFIALMRNNWVRLVAMARRLLEHDSDKANRKKEFNRFLSSNPDDV